MPGVDEVRFARSRHEETGNPAITVEVNGRLLPEVMREVELPYAHAEGHPALAGDYAPVEERRFGEPANTHFGGSAESHLFCGPHDKTVLYACTCAEPGCWPLMARITVGDETVEWTDFEQPHRRGKWSYEGFGLRFDRTQYDAALAGLGVAS